jgi:hypothetical protein
VGFLVIQIDAVDYLMLKKPGSMRFKSFTAYRAASPADGPLTGRHHSKRPTDHPAHIWDSDRTHPDDQHPHCR